MKIQFCKYVFAKNENKRNNIKSNKSTAAPVCCTVVVCVCVSLVACTWKAIYHVMGTQVQWAKHVNNFCTPNFIRLCICMFKRVYMFIFFFFFFNIHICMYVVCIEFGTIFSTFNNGVYKVHIYNRHMIVCTETYIYKQLYMYCYTYMYVHIQKMYMYVRIYMDKHVYGCNDNS